MDISLINTRKFALSLILFFSLIVFFMQISRADVISLNSGGSQEIAVTPDKYVEGFFSGIEGIVAEEEEQPPTSGGGGGGSSLNINVDPSELNINLAIDTTIERTITVTNLGTRSATVSVTQSNLGSHIIIENSSVTIPAGQSVDVNFVFVALSEPGIFMGTINIGGEAVLVSINVKTKLLLFDSNIVVLNENYLVPQGEELRTRVTLIPFGDPERLDVGLFFTIMDYAGKIYLTKSETLLVETLTEIDRNFDTGSLPLGEYVVGLELRYPNGVAPSSAHFEVIQARGEVVGGLILYLISLILLVLIIILLILIWRRKEEEKEKSSMNK